MGGSAQQRAGSARPTPARPELLGRLHCAEWSVTDASIFLAPRCVLCRSVQLVARAGGVCKPTPRPTTRLTPPHARLLARATSFEPRGACGRLEVAPGQRPGLACARAACMAAGWLCRLFCVELLLCRRAGRRSHFVCARRTVLQPSAACDLSADLRPLLCSALAAAECQHSRMLEQTEQADYLLQLAGGCMQRRRGPLSWTRVLTSVD